jgi:hypothetical protein
VIRLLIFTFKRQNTAAEAYRIKNKSVSAQNTTSHTKTSLSFVSNS